MQSYSLMSKFLNAFENSTVECRQFWCLQRLPIHCSKVLLFLCVLVSICKITSLCTDCFYLFLLSHSCSLFVVSAISSLWIYCECLRLDFLSFIDCILSSSGWCCCEVPSFDTWFCTLLIGKYICHLLRRFSYIHQVSHSLFLSLLFYWNYFAGVTL